MKIDYFINIYIIFLYVKRFISIFIMMVVNSITPEIKPVKNNIIYKSQSELDKNYVENNRSTFLKMISHNFNSNIDPIFYNIKEYNQLLKNENNELETIWKTRIMIETTSRGNLIMFFDVYKFGFSYFSDENIPYIILNAAAMKYVKTFHCFDFFIDNQLLKGESSPLLMLQNNHTDSTVKPVLKHIINNNNNNNADKPFARFKKYNNLPITPMSLSTNKNLKSIKHESVIEEFNKNKFMYLGKIQNFCLLKQNKGFNTNSNFNNIFAGEAKVQKLVLSYNDFKNIKTNLPPLNI